MCDRQCGVDAVAQLATQCNGRPICHHNLALKSSRADLSARQASLAGVAHICGGNKTTCGSLDDMTHICGGSKLVTEIHNHLRTWS